MKLKQTQATQNKNYSRISSERPEAALILSRTSLGELPSKTPSSLRKSLRPDVRINRATILRI